MIEEKHRGHDLMHAEMLLILFGSIMVAQILLFVWRQKRPRYAHSVSRLVHTSIPSLCALLLLLPLLLSLLLPLLHCFHMQVISECDFARLVGDPSGDQRALDVLEDGCGMDLLLSRNIICHVQSHKKENKCTHTSVNRRTRTRVHTKNYP